MIFELDIFLLKTSETTVTAAGTTITNRNREAFPSSEIFLEALPLSKASKAFYPLILQYNT